MKRESAINKKAWDYKVYEFWQHHNGTIEEHASRIKDNPMKILKRHGKYFEDVKGLRIANPCGSNGRRAIALALLGAEVTVFDISEESKRYALELADACHINLDFVVGDLSTYDRNKYANTFDMLYLEGGILHMFHKLDDFMEILYSMLKPGGKLILNDFHPFRKVMPINYFKETIGNYFDQSIHEGDVSYKQFLSEEDQKTCPSCSYRYYSISEVINTTIQVGFTLKEFTEGPSWTNEKLPGEITICAIKAKELL